MFPFCKPPAPPSAEMEKLRIIEALHREKDKILREMSGVDKYTLAHLREILNEHDKQKEFLNTLNEKNEVIVKAMLDALDSTAAGSNAVAYGVVPDSADSKDVLENTMILNKMVMEGKNIFFPPGTYYFSEPITITEPITIYGSGREETHLIYLGEGSALDIKTGTVTVCDLTLQKFTRNFDTPSIGISIGKTDTSGKYVNVSHVQLRNLAIINFTTSIAGEALFFFTIDNVFTYWDKYGFCLNKRFVDVNGVDSTVETTTILCNHLYCGGSRRSYDTPEGSTGWVLYKASDVTMINCVSECYDIIGEMKNGVNYFVVSPYFEFTNEGLYLENNTGYLMIENPYFNAAASVTKYLIEQSGTHIISYGGRITTPGYTYINKKSAFRVLILTNPIGADTVVGSSNGWDYTGVLSVDENFRVTVQNATDAGFSVTRYGAGTSMTPEGIKREGSGTLAVKIGDKTVGGFTENGMQLIDSTGTIRTLKIVNNTLTIT